ncbi:glycoside hydrolase family 43 protein [Planoprotostelium fungivorum]|uniref:Glycoside hydrolase family 43 protein n=1 Tax=Planoprotostelium fungivorum TaxID=1890364 RepID=A0A2P6NMC3_9EUKA|nr:glycoside hydrolase family 43 protein [Planoprotostelium fungivorum]
MEGVESTTPSNAEIRQKKSRDSPKKRKQTTEKKKFKDRVPQYGNYPAYYSYRNERLEDDPRVKFMKQEWFSFRDVLDIGCNRGDITTFMAEFFGPKHITGIDIDKNLIDEANKLKNRLRTPKPYPEDFPISFKILPRFPNNLSFTCGNILETRLDKIYGLISCLSTTKWIHLNFGDRGIIGLFRSVWEHLYVDGYFLLEPQEWSTYKKKKRVYPPSVQHFKSNYDTIKLKPNHFQEYLEKNGFQLVTHELLVEGQQAAGFQRPMFLFKKIETTETPSFGPWIDHVIPEAPKAKKKSPKKRREERQSIEADVKTMKEEKRPVNVKSHSIVGMFTGHIVKNDRNNRYRSRDCRKEEPQAKRISSKTGRRYKMASTESAPNSPAIDILRAMDEFYHIPREDPPSANNLSPQHQRSISNMYTNSKYKIMASLYNIVHAKPQEAASFSRLPIFLMGKCYLPNGEVETHNASSHLSQEERQEQNITNTNTSVLNIFKRRAQNANPPPQNIPPATPQQLRPFYEDFSSVMCFCYRKDFAPLEPVGLSTDLGWGCMLRTGQMMLATVLRRLILGREWKLDYNDPPKAHSHYRQILRWFHDDPGHNCPYSIHNMLRLSREIDKRRGQRNSPGDRVGEWFTPTRVSQILKHTVNQHAPESLRMYVSSDSVIYKDQVYALTRGDRDRLKDMDMMKRQSMIDIGIRPYNDPAAHLIEWHPIFILVPLRLGIEKMNAMYMRSVQFLLSVEQSVGIVGGRPKQSLYFVGFQGDELIYLDPHVVRPSVKPEDEFVLQNYHCTIPQKMSIEQMDPSLCVGFFCRNEEEFEQLCGTISAYNSGNDHIIISVEDSAPHYISEEPDPDFADVVILATLNALFGFRAEVYNDRNTQLDFLMLGSKRAKRWGVRDVRLSELISAYKAESTNTMKVTLCLLSFLSVAAAFHNPVNPMEYFADPWIFKVDRWYYLAASTGTNNITILRSRDFSNYNNLTTENQKVVWQAPPDIKGALWAPEVHMIDGSLYMYLAATNGTEDNAARRMYVLKAETNDPFGNWNLAGRVYTPDDNWAIDGTVWQHDNGKKYFIWSGWTDAQHPLDQYLYIAEMESPTQLIGERVLLHSPSQPWMKSNGQGVNEGPEILKHGDFYYLIYSAAGSWGPDYCLAMMVLMGDDPLNPSHWWSKDDAPVFQSGNGVYAPGHASFTKDDSGQHYIFYHAVTKPTDSWGQRTVRTEPFHFGQKGWPIFPHPAKNFTQEVRNPKIFRGL